MAVDTKQMFENLEALLTTKKFKTVKESLKRFEKDDWLMTNIVNLSSKAVSSNNVSGELATLTQVIDCIISAPYAFEEPTLLGEFYQSLYSNSFSSSALVKYEAVVSHMNSVQAIDPALVTAGALPTQAGQYANQQSVPLTYKDGSYGGLVKRVHNDADKKISTQEALGLFLDHLVALSKKGIQVAKLVEKDYVSVLQQVYEKGKGDTSALKGRLEEVEKTVANLNEKGFNIYHSGFAGTLKGFVTDNNVSILQKVTGTYNKNTLILKLGLRLANDE